MLASFIFLIQIPIGTKQPESTGDQTQCAWAEVMVYPITSNAVSFLTRYFSFVARSPTKSVGQETARIIRVDLLFLKTPIVHVGSSKTRRAIVHIQQKTDTFGLPGGFRATALVEHRRYSFRKHGRIGCDSRKHLDAIDGDAYKLLSFVTKRVIDDVVWKASPIGVALMLRAEI